MQSPGHKPEVRKVILSAVLLSPFLAALLVWCVCLPRDPFRSIPTSTVVEDANGELLGARVAEDGQ